MNFFIDPYIFALDKNSISKNQLEDFINNLLDWKKLIDLNWGSVYKPSDTFELLFKYNLYPLVDKLKELVEKFHIDYIQPEEIDKIVNSILNKLPTIEDLTEINDILIDSDNWYLLGNRNNDFIHLLKKLLIILKLHCRLNNKNENGQVILSKEIGDSVTKFEATISMIDSTHSIDLPVALNIEFFNFENFKTFCREFKPSFIWLNAQSELCMHIAVYVHLIQINPKLDYIFSNSKPNFVLNNSFFKSIYDLNFHSDEKKIEMLLRALVEEILHTNMKDTHELREHKSGGSNQIKQNGYLAWRRDIDYEYHIHYWKKNDTIIFTDIVNHNNYNISKI